MDTEFMVSQMMVPVFYFLSLCCAGSQSGTGSIPSEAPRRSWPGDTGEPLGYKGPDSEGSQVHDP